MKPYNIAAEPTIGGTKRALQVTDRLDKIDTEIKILTERFAQLESRIGPILRPQTPANCQPDGEKVPESFVPLAARLDNFVNAIMHLRSCVEDTTDRLEI